MIDLHSHTTASDGTFSPAELIEAALAAKLEALAVTDHDTFSGFDEAKRYLGDSSLLLICGIELSTKLEEPVRRTVHLLGYFPRLEPSSAFLEWIQSLQASRRDRNQRLARRLQTMGLDITIEAVEAIGRSMTGRPHFAKLMVEKGYCENTREAFDRYLDESAPGYVDRDEPSLAEGISKIRDAGGVTSLAHPIRLGKREADDEELLIASLCDIGLQAIEAYHSDQTEEDTARYLAFASKYGLKVTGGSDFHGENKPSISLGRGPGHLAIPKSLLEELWRA